MTAMEVQNEKDTKINLWYWDRKKDSMSIQQWINNVQNEKGNNLISFKILQYV